MLINKKIEAEKEDENTAVAGDIFDLADAFLSIESMRYRKLQKICYYAKAWHLALFDCNLIAEHFEAWVGGAMQPELYEKYKGYGLEKIPKKENTEGIPKEFLSFAEEVFAAYGHLSDFDLEWINHREQPWIEARGGCEPWEHCTNVILEESMRWFYGAMVERKTKN